MKYSQLTKLEKHLKDEGIVINENIKSLINSLNNEITIANKLSAKLNHFTKKDLLKVHHDTEVAKELILIILSNFSNTFILSLVSDEKSVKQGFKRLYSKIMREQVYYDKRVKTPYKIIIDILIKEGIIEKGENYSTSKKSSNEYRLTDRYRNNGLTNYKVKTKIAKRLCNKQRITNLEKAASTAIGRNELYNLSRIELPSINKAETHLRNKIKEGYRNKKGKRLYILGKKKRDSQKLYMEDYLEIYKYLKYFFNIPILTEEKAGHRVITKYNMMPSVIREIITIDNEYLVECDYSTLHPNIANRIYRGTNNISITHDEVAKALGITRKEAKIEHLSFLNKKIADMKRSPLYKYYNDNHFHMLFNLEADKIRYKTHKITSQKLFSVEVQMMEEVILILHGEGIETTYVFDCLFSKEEDVDRVKEVMNQVAKNNKIKTKV
jgi:hypothetical protein